MSSAEPTAEKLATLTERYLEVSVQVGLALDKILGKVEDIQAIQIVLVLEGIRGKLDEIAQAIRDDAAALDRHTRALEVQAAALEARAKAVEAGFTLVREGLGLIAAALSTRWFSLAVALSLGALLGMGLVSVDDIARIVVGRAVIQQEVSP